MKEETSLEEVIREADFLPLLEARVRSFVSSCKSFVEREIDDINKGILGHLNEEAKLLESFLDDYEARNNRTFANFTELVASVRNITGACYIQRHILRRYFKYHLDDDVAQVAAFHMESGRSFKFLVESVMALAREALREAADGLGLPVAEGPAEPLNLADPLPKSHLPRNVDEDRVGNVEQPIVEIARVCLQAAKELTDIGAADLDTPEAIKSFVAQNLPEERVIKLEAQVHGLQSKYDTYVKDSRAEQEDPTLPKLRGHISMALHLLELTMALVHFYERHENDIRSVEAKRRISRVVDKNEILRLIVGYGFRYAQVYVERGGRHASKLLQEYSLVTKLELELPDGIYLHARPASLIVSVVQHHGSPVLMEVGGEKVEANSIIQVLMLSGKNSKARKVTFYGDETPLADLKTLFQARLGEKGLDKLPPSLAFLIP